MRKFYCTKKHPKVLSGIVYSHQFCVELSQSREIGLLILNVTCQCLPIMEKPLLLSMACKLILWSHLSVNKLLCLTYSKCRRNHLMDIKASNYYVTVIPACIFDSWFARTNSISFSHPGEAKEWEIEKTFLSSFELCAEKGQVTYAVSLIHL